MSSQINYLRIYYILIVYNFLISYYFCHFMKNQSILVAIVALTCVTVLAGCNSPSKTTPSQPTTQQPTASLFNSVYASDSYVEYTPAALVKAKADGKNTAIFFHSKTCGSCAKLDANFEENEVIMPEELVVFKADWNENQELAGELNVATYHTVAYYNEDGSTNNIKGLFTVEEVVQAWTQEVLVENAWAYEVYTQQALAQAQVDGKETALFFHSKTCGSCAKLDTAITQDAVDLPENLVVFKTDWNDNQDLAKKYNVAKYHTIAFMNEDGSSKNVKGLFTVGDVVAAYEIWN